MFDKKSLRASGLIEDGVDDEGEKLYLETSLQRRIATLVQENLNKKKNDNKTMGMAKDEQAGVF